MPQSHSLCNLSKNDISNDSINILRIVVILKKPIWDIGNYDSEEMALNDIYHAKYMNLRK